MDPLPTSTAAAIGDAVAEGLGLLRDTLAYKNTPEEHAQAIAAMNAEHYRAVRLALETNNLDALRLLLTPATP